MTDREAIELVKSYIDNVKKLFGDDGSAIKGSSLYDLAFEFFPYVLTAIQERDERNRGCKYCNSGDIHKILAKIISTQTTLSFEQALACDMNCSYQLVCKLREYALMELEKILKGSNNNVGN